MADFVFNIAKGRIVELYSRVENNDPANSALVIVPIETDGLESDATLIDADTLAAVLSGTTDEQTTMGRKVLTDSDLASVPAPDDTSDYREVSAPNVTWTGASGNAVSCFLVCYDPDTTSGDDTEIVPLTKFDLVFTPNGLNFTLTGGAFHRAA